MMWFKPVSLLGLVASLIMGACNPGIETAPTGTPLDDITLTPYQTPTIIHTATSAHSGVVTQTAIPLPSPTARIHTVQSGENLLQIALQYGLTYEAILAANPAISPSMLSIGQQLVIPEGDGGSPIGVESTPQPLTLMEQPCYPDVDGGAWCLVRVMNTSQQGVESVILGMRLMDADGKQIVEKQAPAPLNGLPSGNSLPVGIYFSPPLPDFYQLQVEIEVALPYAEDGRYLPVTALNDQQTLAADGRLAVISGTSIVENSGSLKRLSILAVAYGMNEQLLGMRLWQQVFPDGASGEIRFDMMLYSLGGEIERVELQAEAEAQ